MANLEAYGEKIVGLTGSVVSWTQTQASGTKIAEIDIDGTTTDVYAPSGGGGSVNYSTTEQVVGTWIDGKPIYQRTFDGLNFGGTMTAWTNTGVTISDVDVIIRGTCIRVLTGDNAVSNMFCFRVNNGNLQYYTPRSMSNCSTIILEYTKTTD